MSIARGAIGVCEYSAVSTNTQIVTGRAYLHGIVVNSKTTGAPKVAIYDATATNTGNLIISGATTGAQGCNVLMLHTPVAIKLGIYCSWVAGTSAADGVTVFYTQA